MDGDDVGCSNCGGVYTQKDGRPYCETCQKYGEYKLMPPYDELLKKYEECLKENIDLKEHRQMWDDIHALE